MEHNPTQKALDFINTHQQEIIQCAKDLVAAPSPNPPGDERLVVDVAKRYCHKLKLGAVQVLGPRPERPNLVCKISNRIPGPVLLLNGHLDTKPPLPLENWNTDPYQPIEKDGFLIGLGAADMKGPDAALIYGVAAAQAADPHLPGEIILALSADEEGKFVDGARYLVQDMGITADAALIAEPIGINHSWESIPLVSRGLSCLKFFLKGTQVHSSICDRIPVVNASLEASRLLLFLEEHLKLTYSDHPFCPYGPTINLGATVKAGSAYAIVSGEAEITVDIRTIPGMSKNQLEKDINRVLDEFRRQYPNANVAWAFFEGTLGWSEPMEIPATLPIVNAVQEASKAVLGQSPPLGYFPGGTDAVWWQGAGGIPTIPGYGPGRLTDCHQPNESIRIADIIDAARIYAILILNYLQTND
jgi:acetylornithine deacetylase/succinyl-diaminopimelate desuccinylase-like protein